MDYDKLFIDLSEHIIKCYDKKYSIEKLDSQLKMDMPFNNQVLNNLIFDNCKAVSKMLNAEQKIGFAKYCEKNKQNFMNTMLATKYEDNTFYARSFIEYEICSKLPEYMNVKNRHNFSANNFEETM